MEIFPRRRVRVATMRYSNSEMLEEASTDIDECEVFFTYQSVHWTPLLDMLDRIVTKICAHSLLQGTIGWLAKSVCQSNLYQRSLLDSPVPIRNQYIMPRFTVLTHHHLRPTSWLPVRTGYDQRFYASARQLASTYLPLFYTYQASVSDMLCRSYCAEVVSSVSSM